MKKRLWILPLALIAVAGLFMTGCEEMWADQDALVRTSAVVEGCEERFDIWAGQNTDAGDVVVWNCDDYVIVHIIMHEPWVMTQSQLAWAETCEELPRNKKGDLVPGKFPENTKHDPAVTEYVYKIPIEDWDEICIAFHCVVEIPGTGREETGWGDSWKGCFWFKLRDCKDVILPAYPIDMRVCESPWEEENCYAKVELSGIGDEEEYNVWDGYWKAWCSEKGVPIGKGIWYEVTLFSSQDPNLPYRLANGPYGPRRWDCVNWLLNNKPSDATIDELQDAIWYLVGELAAKPGGDAGAIVDDAIYYGTGFRAAPKQLMAVILLTKEKAQLLFIEVDP